MTKEQQPLGTELVIGLVSAIGTDQDRVCGFLADIFRTFNYSARNYRLSNYLENLEVEGLDKTTEAKRLGSYMTAGNELRRVTGLSSILALHAIADIHRQREEQTGEKKPGRRVAHVLRSLKHPAEVNALRDVYGTGFFLIGSYASEDVRLNQLHGRYGIPKDEARALIERDQNETEAYGQKTRDVFSSADVFIQCDPSHQEKTRSDLDHFLCLVFGSTTITPNLDEHAMYLAHASSLRSGALGRQVGACIVSEKGDVVATGANDAPRPGGGQYWPGEGDQRDLALGSDSNEKERGAVFEDVFEKVCSAGVKEGCEPRVKEAVAKSRLRDITEYGRDVHAEMDALMLCARKGVSPVGATLYTTTFPCHNCAKHIIAAGLKKVVFVEPYPKSRASDLHNDAISLDTSDDEPERVKFVPFWGVGARRYAELFSVMDWTGPRRERKSEGNVVELDRTRAKPVSPLTSRTYLDWERLATKAVADSLKAMGGADDDVQTKNG